MRIHSWVERVHIQVKCFAQGHNATPRQPRPAPETSQSKMAGRNHRATTSCIHVCYGLGLHTQIKEFKNSLLRYRDTEACHWQGSLWSSVVLLRPTQWQWDGTAIYAFIRGTRDTQSPKLKGEKFISISLSRNGLQTRPAGVRGEHATTALLLPSIDYRLGNYSKDTTWNSQNFQVCCKIQ